MAAERVPCDWFAVPSVAAATRGWNSPRVEQALASTDDYERLNRPDNCLNGQQEVERSDDQDWDVEPHELVRESFIPRDVIAAAYDMRVD